MGIVEAEIYVKKTKGSSKEEKRGPIFVIVV